jgi:hypothetical protein
MIPDLIPPPGTAYMWARYSLYGDVDAENLAAMESGGWTYVQPFRYPHVASQDKDKIVVRGLVLMELSAAVELEAKRQAQRVADEAYNKAAVALERDTGVEIEKMDRVKYVRSEY